METSMMQEREQDVDRLRNEYAHSESILKKTIGELQSKYDALAAEYTGSEAENGNLKKLIQHHKAAKRQKEEEFNDLKQESVYKEEQAATRLELEKKQITETYERAIGELHLQCEEHRKNFETCSCQANEIKAKLAQAKLQISRLQKEKRHAESECELLKGQCERERKLMETTIRASKISTESQWNLKLDELRGKLEGEKRRILAIGTDAFRSFLNTSERINEATFRTVVEKARNEIGRLSKSDSAIRRLLGATESQTTEDAVAQLVMNI
jgi:DNA repair exonuclease SbcCD ATPase subunit